MSGALTWARLSFRQQKWELLLVILAVVGAAAGMLWLANTLTTMRAANPDCLAGIGGGFVGAEQQPSIACEAITSRYYETEGFASTFINAAWAAPFVMGVILGAPLVAREIDGGTAQLAWSLSRSRVAWLLRRIAFIAVLGLVLLAVLAVTSEVLASAIFSDRPLSEDFTWYGRRGPLVVARGVGAIALGILVGALIGRVLPAVLASGIVIALVFTGVSFGLDQWNRAEATLERRFLDAMLPSETELTALGVAYGIETNDGEFLTYEEAYHRGLDASYGGPNGEVYTSEADMQAGRSIGHDAFLIIPGERYLELVIRDSVVAVLLGAVALAVAGVVVSRRRPV
jgi:hypothetical protein